MKKKKSWIQRIIQRIGYFFYSLYTAPVHVIKKLGKPIAVLVVVVVLYQAWGFLAPMMRGIKLTSLPSPKRQTTAPEHVVRSAPTYHAPNLRHSNSSSTAHPYNPVSNTITITQPVMENKPIVPYTTPDVLPVYPHRRAYQVVPQAHPSNNNIATPPSNAAAPESSEPPHSVPPTNSAEQ